MPEKRNVPILVGHLLEYHPVVERLRGCWKSRSWATLFYLYSQRVNLGQIRPDENALWSFGPHDVSVALFLLGRDAGDPVSAQGKLLPPAGHRRRRFPQHDLRLRRDGPCADVLARPAQGASASPWWALGRWLCSTICSRARSSRIYDKGVNRPPGVSLLRRKPHDSRGRHLHSPAAERGAADRAVPAFPPGGPRRGKSAGPITPTECASCGCSTPRPVRWPREAPPSPPVAPESEHTRCT